jgi:starch synthase
MPRPERFEALVLGSGRREKSSVWDLIQSPKIAERVLYVTPELADYVKAGGLGEVSASLPRALRAHCDVRVPIPGYRQVLRHPDVLHLNDWPSALAPSYLAWRGLRSITSPIRACSEHSGSRSSASLRKPFVYHASHITTVSSTYAREITRPEFGCGLDGLLRGRADEGRLTGILNGIEVSVGPAGIAGVSRPSDDAKLQNKNANATRVRSDFRLAPTRGPLFAIVSRLVHQKGVDLAIEATEEIVNEGGQLVAIGEGDRRLEQGMADLARRHPGHVRVQIGFDQNQAQRIYAASDFLLMPSRFEPCGLGQMYAQRFGSLPIAHRTGGLADTIQDGVTGFLFGHPSVAGLIGAIRRALQVFGSHSQLSAMRRVAMAQPFDWSRSASRYAALCQSVLSRTGTLNVPIASAKS